MRNRPHIYLAVLSFFILPLVAFSQNNSDIFQGSDGDGHDHFRQSMQSNNDIFAGGIGDGHDRRYYLPQPSNSIFSGSAGDGHDFLKTLQLSAGSIFSGGTGDGHDHSRFTQSSGNMIFAGGTGDGHDELRFRSRTSNNIFSGGNADGHDYLCYFSPSMNSIFAGGIGDGHVLHCYTLRSNSGIFAGSFGDGHDENCFDGIPTPPCPEDINEDGIVNIWDFLQLNSVYGQVCFDCPEDINKDGIVDMADFLQFNTAYGTFCPGAMQLETQQLHTAGEPLSLVEDVEEMNVNDIHPEIMEKLALQQNGLAFTLYPNPNSGHEIELFLTRNKDHIAPFLVDVVDVRGRMLFSLDHTAFAKTQSEVIRFDSPLSTGMYIVHLMIDGERMVKRFEVQ